jgi:predicted MFS family arabinose efflux permease
MKKALLAAAVVASAMPTVSNAAIDLGAAASGITTDLGAAQTLALPIFAIMFGIVLVLSFFKKATH